MYKRQVLKQKILSNIEFIDNLLGVGGSDAYEYFQAGINEETKQKIKELIQKRDKAKKEKDYKTADKIREELKDMGILLQDTPNGTVWEKA